MKANGFLAQVPIDSFGPDEVATLQGFEGLFQNAVSAILGLAGIALFIMLIWGGFSYMTSGGDPKKLEAAKSTLTYAIGGIILVACSFLVLEFIERITGASLTNFRVFIP